ncbi:MAG: hypothetical protein WKF84_07475 [Pyrinomonadaceae bacterium]
MEALIPLPNIANAPDGGTRNNFATSGSEIFDANAYNVRIDGRLTEKLNIFGRYSFLGSLARRPDRFRSGRRSGTRDALVVNRKDAIRSLALGADYTLSPTAIVDVRVWFLVTRSMYYLSTTELPRQQPPESRG